MSASATTRQLHLAPALKAAFEQIFAAPLLFRGILPKLGATPADDALWRVDYDGSFSAQSGNELAQWSRHQWSPPRAKDWAHKIPSLHLNAARSKSPHFPPAPPCLGQAAWYKDQGIEFSAMPTRYRPAQGKAWPGYRS